MRKYITLILVTVTILCASYLILSAESKPRVIGNDYYIDAVNGNDNNNGSKSNPWKTISKVSSTSFQPGDHIYFKRGTSYSGCVTIHGDGTPSNPITIGAYGSGNAPQFTNPSYNLQTKGNAMRIRGDYQIVENLYFHNTAPAPPHVGYHHVWDAGALHISLGSDHVIIRNNEFSECPKAIQSYSQYSLITNNYIHDTNNNEENGFLSYPYWGPIGIQLGIGNQEISYNTIEGMYATGGKYGADGGAIEIDDGRNHKDNIYIHHNTTSKNCGFIEVSYWADIQKRSTSNIDIEYNVGDDYQSALLWWAPTSNSTVKNNTFIRDNNQIAGPWKGVFILDEPPGNIEMTKNIIVVGNNMNEAVFIQGYNGAVNDVGHRNNCYWNADGGNITLGLSYGPGEIEANPKFADFDNANYYLQSSSPVIGWGALGVYKGTSQENVG